jgi:adenylate cyclase
LADAVIPSVGIGLVYAAMLGFTLTEVQTQRRTLRRQLEAQREASARVAGELEAARRIQMGILPNPADALGGDDRVKLYAFLDPARSLGGDLYDFFRLDGDRLFFLVGDVSGQGVPGSLFMAVSKALCKSIALRRAGDLGAMMREFNTEISRDNAEALFRHRGPACSMRPPAYSSTAMPATSRRGFSTLAGSGPVGSQRAEDRPSA